jgi:hypothetical protein
MFLRIKKNNKNHVKKNIMLFVFFDSMFISVTVKGVEEKVNNNKTIIREQER